ncbi:hypothetical protein AN639_11830 [Candidatus Epulonipiscium fishelsonii]|nr:hypothetical protein AN639_11830 [Epulopiscium sp. SCG-B05WGA-EpuloA1]
MNKKYVFKSISEPVVLNIYKTHTGKTMDVQSPQTFNEKVHWTALYAKDPELFNLTDKYKVRRFIKDKIGEKYLVKCLGIYNSWDEINFDQLPNQFVIKATVACGENIIVTNKQELDLKEAERKFNMWITDDAIVKSKILIEEYLENDNQDLYDYKFYCFDGKVKFILYVFNRNIEMTRVIFDANWQRQDFITHGEINKIDVDKPDNLEEMINIAEILSKGFAHVRVDLYRLNNGDIKFGELTFHNRGGNAMWNPPIADFNVGQFFNIEPLKMKLVNQFETRKVIFFSQVYNAEQTIENAYKSLQNQTEENWIWHVVDNGSSDNTYKFLEGYEAKDNRIVLHRNKTKNVIIEGNSLVDIALNYNEDDYFAILEADGEYAPTFIEESKIAAISDNVNMVLTGFSLTNLNENISDTELILLGHMHKLNFFVHYHNSFKVKGGKLFFNKVLLQSNVANDFSEDDILKNMDFCMGILSKSENSVRIPSILYKQHLPNLQWRSNLVEDIINFYEKSIKYVATNSLDFIQVLTFDFISDTLNALFIADIDISQKHKELLKIGNSTITNDIIVNQNLGYSLNKHNILNIKRKNLFKETATWMLNQPNIEDDIILEFAQIGQIFCASAQWEEGWIKFRILHANALLELGKNMILKGENELAELQQMLGCS